MKKFLALFVVITISTSTLFAACKDPNLRGAEDIGTYDKLQYLKRFTKIAEVDSPPPAGFEGTFGEGKYLCRDVTAIFLKHYSGTVYVIYTTHQDYCDGGNTIGIMLDMDKYSNEDSDPEDAIVAIVGDSEFMCDLVAVDNYKDLL